MFLKHLELDKFRSFETFSISLSPALNLLMGDNAKGKTTILEAIHLACLAKSFRTRSDLELCHFGEKEYRINGSFVGKNNIERRVIVSYNETNGRSIAVNGKQILRYSELIGNFPAVALSSLDHKITAGPPADRRRFVDLLLCQLSSRYLSDLKDYIRVLKQRNHIIHNVSQGKKVDTKVIEPWDIELVNKGSEIIKARKSLCKELDAVLENIYYCISKIEKKFEINYLPSVKFSNLDDINKSFLTALTQSALREKKMGFCVVGPHRDDFNFLINNRELRRFGSRGEHKTALISLKVAESQIISSRKQETPVLLLDDLFSELDDKRSINVLQLFDKGVQIIVTSKIIERQTLNKLLSGFESKVNVFVFDNSVVKSENV